MHKEGSTNDSIVFIYFVITVLSGYLSVYWTLIDHLVRPRLPAPARRVCGPVLSTRPPALTNCAS
jgi:hypothetical protein